MLLLDELLWADTTGVYRFDLVDEADVTVNASQINELTLTYYDWVDGTIINGRENQNVLNANNVELITPPGSPIVTTLTWLIQQADTVILHPGQPWEIHVAIFRWSWAGMARRGAHQMAFGVRTLPYTP
jgi:hypothetical protein